MKKITINMLSSADKIDGQGVGSAYLEQVNLLKEGTKDIFEIMVNSNKKADIIHHHTIDLDHFFKMQMSDSINVAYVHFLPTTLDGSIKLPKAIFPVFKKYVISFYNSADYLVVVNPSFIPELVNCGIQKEKIIYIPNYVSKENFYKKPNTEIKKIRKKYGFKEDDFIVLGAGQVQTRKGVKDFIEVAQKTPDINYVWCGGFSFGKITDGYEELKKIVENPPKNVKFLGIIPREEMNDIFNMSDVLFVPSYNELFPMTILEAVNSHKPLILRDLELYEEILFKKYLKGHNNKEFINKINELKDNKELYQEYSEYSKEISEFYSKENVLKLWIDFYTKIYNEKKEETKQQ